MLNVGYVVSLILVHLGQLNTPEILGVHRAAVDTAIHIVIGMPLCR